MVTKRLRNLRARSSALASLGTLQPQALGFLNRLVTLVSVSNLYILVKALPRVQLEKIAQGRSQETNIDTRQSRLLY